MLTTSRIPEKAGFHFPNEHPEYFAVLVDFLYNARLAHWDDAQGAYRKPFSFEDLVNLFKLANYLEMPCLRNAVLDKFFEQICESPTAVPYEIVRKIYETTEKDSSLRSMIVEVVINLGQKSVIDEWGKKFPNRFLMDCLLAAAEAGTVPFRQGDVHVVAWLIMKRERLCFEVHKHNPLRPKMPAVSKYIKKDHEMSNSAKPESVVKAPVGRGPDFYIPGSANWNGKMTVDDGMEFVVEDFRAEKETESQKGENELVLEQMRIDAAERMETFDNFKPTRTRY